MTDYQTIRRQQRRLKRLFGALIVAIGAPAAVQACGSSSSRSAGVAPSDAVAVTPDGTTTEGPDDDAAVPGEDAAKDAVKDAGKDAPAEVEQCLERITLLDAAPDGEERCTYEFPCGFPYWISTIGCDLALGSGLPPCRVMDGLGCTADAFSGDDGSAVTIVCSPCTVGGGRRFAGLRSFHARGPSSPLDAYLARMAHDEAASVEAFRRIEGELALFCAPRALLKVAARATKDEARHARVFARLLSARDRAAPRPRFRKPRVRSLEAFARENAVEGCVRETFGALVAAWQAENAADPSIARAFIRIAEDERRHAALAWALSAWVETRLAPDARARIRRAQTNAVLRLRDEIAAAPGHAWMRDVGLPSPESARTLLDRMARGLGLMTS